MFGVAGCKAGADHADENNVLKVVSMVNTEGKISWVSKETEATDIREFVVEDISERSDEMRKAVNAVTDGSIRKNLKIFS